LQHNLSVLISLPITVDELLPISINAQITEQIKMMIAMGNLKPGDALPTVIQLSEYLHLNHNTIALVYANLAELGYLVTRKGRGTFVANTAVVQQAQSRQHIYQLLDQAFLAAAQVGLSPSDFGVAAYARAVMLNQHPVVLPQVAFVECFQHDSDSYLHTIQEEIGSRVTFLQLEDLEFDQPMALTKLHSADIVITTTQHIWRVTEITAPEQEVIGVGAQVELQLLGQIAALPSNTQVLLVSRGGADGEYMKQMLEQAGISHLKYQVLGIECFQQYLQLLDNADVVCASAAVYDYVRKLSPKFTKVMKFSFGIDRASAIVLKARLAATKPRALQNLKNDEENYSSISQAVQQEKH
jgi:DNA-binding transcriptional regulator YhcF (GntR family)